MNNSLAMRHIEATVSLALLATLCGNGNTAAIASQRLDRSHSSIPPHVLTADYVSAGDDGYTGDPARLAPYTSWANDPSTKNAARYQTLGVKLYRYENPFRAYKTENDFTYEDMLHLDPDAVARDCAGHEITSRDGVGLITDPRKPSAATHFANVVHHDSADFAGVHFDAWFSDDTDNLQELDQAREPCGFEQSVWMASTERMWRAATVGSRSVPIIFNGLGLAMYGQSELSHVSDPQVIGAMWEGCYGGANGFGIRGDYLNGLDHRWDIIEATEIAVVSKHKNFWCYNENSGAALTSIKQRLFTYGSFLLTYDVATSIYETAYNTPSGARVMPETAFVALDSNVPAPTTIQELRTSTGVYEREYNRCYLKAVYIGSCAVAVNPDPHAKLKTPYRERYTRLVRIAGSGILDGGIISVAHANSPAMMEPLSALLLIK